MKLNLTEIVFILDRSGSMSRIEGDTIGGYNSFLKTQRDGEGEAKVTTVLFDDKYMLIHSRTDINNVNPITEKEYFGRGSTALLDAVGRTIVDTGVKLRELPEEDRPSKVIFVIITDGYENASYEFTYKQVNEMISHQQSKYNWEFIFLGANIDAVKEAEHLGIKGSRATNYMADAQGSGVVYASLAENITFFRGTGKINDEWSVNIDNDMYIRNVNNSDLNEFENFLENNKGLKKTSVKDDISRIRIMIRRNIDYTKGEDYSRNLLYKSDLSDSTITSCLRVCRYYKEYLEQSFLVDFE